MASSGLDTICDDVDFPIRDADVPVTPSLASHTEDAIDDPVEQESSQLKALGSATAELSENKFGETKDANEQLQSSETPAVTTRLPGVSDTAISDFRRQMLRTDI